MEYLKGGKMECSFCRKKYETYNREILHHIIPTHWGGKGDAGNKIHICFRCHQKIHALYNRRALEIAVKTKPNFFKDILKDFANGIS